MKRNLLQKIGILLFSSASVFGACPGNTTVTWDGSTGGAPNLNSNDVLCLTGNYSGTFNINGAPATIYIDDGVTWDMGSQNFNGATTIETSSTGTLNVGNDINANGNLTINNSGTLGFTNASDQTLTGVTVTNNGTMSKSTGNLKFQSNSVLNNYSTVNVAAFENAESYLNNFPGAVMNISGQFYNHGAMTNDGLIYSNSMLVTDKGSLFGINNGLISVSGDINLNAGFINNGNLESGGTMNITKPLTGDGTGGVFYNTAQNVTGDGSVAGQANNTSDYSTYSGAYPVSLMSFSGRMIRNTVELQWGISDFNGFSDFEIQRSSDAKHFESIGKQMFSTDKLEFRYTFIDENPAEGLNYYRLKMNDLDGKYEYSKIVGVDFASNAHYFLFENPSRGQSISIETNAENPQFMVFDDLGREVNFKLRKSNGLFEITPRNVVYDMLIISMLTDQGRQTKRALLSY
ncbi:hypothetical protein [Jiulongibacter sp. NS-SX5]|uniref:hypothetical protein n=1 Tax=Jiulongibacter sp. NS-SX5 TaxID=3463854 RepID=UPI004059D386